jgi:ABC-type Fe3+ transport system permease subunit
MRFRPAPSWPGKFWPSRGLAGAWPAAETTLGGAVTLVASLPLLLLLRDATGLADPTGFWDQRTLRLLGHTLRLAAGVTAGALALAAAVLVVLALTRSSRLRGLLLLAVGATCCIPPVVHLSAWQMLGAPLGLAPGFNAGLVLAWSYFPLAFFLLWLGLLNLNPASLETGRLLGEPGGVFRHLVLPPLRPALVTAAALVFLLACAHGEVPSLTGYPVYAEEFLARLVLETDPAAAVALALPLLAMLLVTAPILLYLERGLLARTWKAANLQALVRLWPGQRWGDGMAVAAVGLLALPVLVLLAQAQWTGLVASHGAALTTSLGLGLLGALLAVGLAHLGADALVEGNPPVRAGLLIMVLLQFLLPGPLLALALLELAQTFEALNRGDTLLIVAHSLRVFPLLVLVLAGLRGARAGTNRDQIRLLGIGWFHRQRYLRLPQEWPQLGFAAGLALALILAELPTTILVVAPGTETAVLRLYNLMHYGDWASVAALACATALLVIGSVTLAGLTIGRRHAED